MLLLQIMCLVSIPIIYSTRLKRGITRRGARQKENKFFVDTSHSLSQHVLDLLVPLPPAAHALVDLMPRHAVPDQPHDDAQALDVPVAALVVEEQHLVERYARVRVQLLEVPRLAARVDLQVVEEIDRLL